MQHNLEQQIQARNQSGVSEDALKEFSMMFKHFDKDKSGRLNHHEFKSCLRALGYDLPMVEEGQPDPEFEAILGECKSTVSSQSELFSFDLVPAVEQQLYWPCTTPCQLGIVCGGSLRAARNYFH
jgi:hypothetical protein